MNVLQALIKDAINTDFSTYKKPIFSLKNKVVMVSLDWLRVMFKGKLLLGDEKKDKDISCSFYVEITSSFLCIHYFQ